MQTGAGSTVASGDFVLVTRPHVRQVAEAVDSTPLVHAVTTQALLRGRQYEISGTSLSVKNGAQVLQVGAVRSGGRPIALMSTPDPVVGDPPAGSVPTPRPTLLAVTPSSVASGIGATGTVTLDNPGASIAGFTVALSSSDTTAATVPATLAVPGTTGVFAISTKSVSAARSVTITASSGGARQSQTLSVTPPIPTTLSLAPNDVVAGATVTGHVTFSASAAGTTVALSSSDPSVQAPSSVIVNGNTASFSLVTTEAPAPRTVTMSRAPAADVQLTVATSNPSLIQFDQPTLRVAAGQTSETIALRALSAPATPTNVLITISRSVVTSGFGTVTITATRGVLVVP